MTESKVSSETHSLSYTKWSFRSTKEYFEKEQNNKQL